MEGVGKSMCNYDNHNGGVGVPVDDDSHIYDSSSSSREEDNGRYLTQPNEWG